MLNIPKYKRDCWKKRPVRFSFLHRSRNPGAGLNPFTPYDVVLKDGFMPVDCVKDKLFLHGDKFGDGKFSYKLENISNVSIVHYKEIVPKEDRKPMTQTVCFEFCRTVPDMDFFGIVMGRTCYCAPFYKMVADDSSVCDQPCEGDTKTVCGGKSKSSIFSMHMCASTEADLKKISIATKFIVGDLKGNINLASKLSGKMQESADLNQKVFGMAGDPATSDLMQIAKEFAGDLAATAGAAGRVTNKLSGLILGSAELKDFAKSDTVTAAERLMAKMKVGGEEGKENRAELGKIINFAHPGIQELGSAAQYYPIMYFVDKQYTDTMTTCSGPLVNKPIVGETIDGCASACDAAIHSCIGFVYYGLGESSLCFLFSGFKSAVYWTGCDKEMAPDFLQLQQTSTGFKVDPWPCRSVSRAWQSTTTDSGETSIQALDITTGVYDEVFKIPKDRTKPAFRSINSCGINALDSKLYCSMEINGAGSFLVQIDSEKVGFVAKLPGWQYAGVFDSKDNYYCAGSRGWSVMHDVSKKSAKASLYDLPGPEEFQTTYGSAIGADLAVLEEDLIGVGYEKRQTYLLAVQDATVTMIRVDQEPYKKTALTAQGLPAGKTWAGAWNFKSDIYFASETGEGVYQLNVNSIDLGKKTCKFEKVGKSNKLAWSDGISCPEGLSPYEPKHDPQPKPYTTPEPTTTPTTTTEGPEMEMRRPATTTTKKAVPPPKVGQVVCMAKLSKFEGTTLKPDPAGKCKQCLKKVTKAQRCYD